MGTLAIFYNRFYKKVIIFVLLTITLISYKNDIPYPLFLDAPTFNKNELNSEWKNLKYPCFKVETLSGNWLSDYSGYFSISDYGNFRLNPGLYFGAEIKDYKEKKVLIGYGAEMYSLIQPIDRCVKQEIQRQETHESVFYILGAVKTSICQLHAPHIQSKCKSSYIVQSCSFSKTGSMTGINQCTIGIFGLFQLKEVGLSIVPLKYFKFFENENDVFNYIWYQEN